MAVVLVIVGLLIAGLLGPLSTQIEQRRYEQTRVIEDEAKEALIGYAVAHKWFPCPDVNAIPTGVEGPRNGVNECVTLEGTLPWQVLGIRGIDAWGRYLRYRISANFTDNITFFGITDSGNIRVNSDTGILTTSAVAVLVSHGPNGYGGINTTQASPSNLMPSPTGVDELENSNGLNAIYISHTPTPIGSVNEFDDSLNWISANILVNRMVAAGQLP